MIRIDMWYGDSHKEAERIDVFFYSDTCSYRGNIYIAGEAVGDYVCNDSAELESTFDNLVFNW